MDYVLLILAVALVGFITYRFTRKKGKAQKSQGSGYYRDRFEDRIDRDKDPEVK